MIKKVILGMFLLGFIPNTHTEIKAQSYTTQSKSCGSCGKQVSIHSKIGDYCPHCGVRWGYENERRTTSYKKSYNRKPNYSSNYSSPDYSKSFGAISLGAIPIHTNANLRSKPSTKSKIITKIPAYTSVSIISKSGSWYYISVKLFDKSYVNDYIRTYKGYIHSSLIH